MLVCSSHCHQLLKRCVRSVYTLSASESAATSEWMTRIKSNAIESKGSERRILPVDGLRWLEASLPSMPASSRDGSLASGYLPRGFHLALPQMFRANPPRLEELSKDGTFAGDFYHPPPPFTRRMWASGEFTFNKEKNISIGDPYFVRTKVINVEGKDLTGSEPKIFFKRQFEWGSWSDDHLSGEPAITEDRTHVFLTPSHQKVNRPERPLPDAQFTLSYRPTTTLLFRFSAVSQNDHKIHYEDAYCRDVEGLPGLAVHGPLTALLLTRLACGYLPEGKRLGCLQYRATHPIIVNNLCTLNGVVSEGGEKMTLWATNEAGITGMKVTATLENIHSN